MTNKPSFPAVLLLLVAIAAAMALAGCASEPPPEPTATPDIPATVSAAVSVALGTPVARSVGVRPGYCGRLCDGHDYWSTAGLSDVQAELNQGADVSATDENGWTPLHTAIVYGYVDVVLLLLGAGSDANARNGQGGSPLWLAVSGASDDRSNPEVVALLLEHGADVNAVALIGESAPLMQALHWAVIGNTPASYDIVKVLLDHGADVNAKDDFGSTPLHYASQSGDHNVIALLLDRGANITTGSRDGDTPLHFSVMSDQPANVKTLLDRGGNNDARNDKMQTPCEWALERHTACRAHYRNPDFSSPSSAVTAIVCRAEDTDQAERAQKEIISLLCR